MDIDTHDPIARLIAAASGAAVLSLDYPLAPEAPFPAALGACTRFVRFVAEFGRPAWPHGRRAGRGGRIRPAPILPWPWLWRFATRAARGRERSASSMVPTICRRSLRDLHKRFGGGELPLSVERMTLFRNCYVPDPARRADPLVSPLHADLRGMPPSFLAVASHDPLYDENLAFAARLGDAGAAVELRVYPGTIHGFLEAAAAVEAPVALRAVEDIGRFLAGAFG